MLLNFPYFCLLLTIIQIVRVWSMKVEEMLEKFRSETLSSIEAVRIATSTGQTKPFSRIALINVLIFPISFS